MEKFKNKKCCISFGKSNKRYWFLVLGNSIPILLSIIPLFFVKNEKNVDIKKFSFVSYSFFTCLGESLMVIPYLILKKKIATKKNELIEEDNGSSKINYIFNVNSVNYSTKEKIYFISSVLLKLIVDSTYIIYLSNSGELKEEAQSSLVKLLTISFEFELIFMFLIYKFVYKFRIYQHQYVSILFLTILGLTTFIIRNLDNINEGLILFKLFIQILYSFLKSIITVYISMWMKYKYISPYKACWVFGIINFIIITIIYVIVSLVPCNNENFCIIDYNGKKYIDNILIIFKVQYLIVFLFFILKAIILVINYIIINEFSIFHSFLVIQLEQITELLRKDYKDDIYLKVFINVLLIAISIFFILMLLEIIEINICNLSQNTKKNIGNRAILDKELSAIFEDFDGEEEEKDEKDENEKKDEKDV